MKKLLFLMMALMVAPAMAAVTFEVVDNADHTGSIWVTVSDADTVGSGNVYSLIAGIAIDVEVDGSADIVAVTEYMTTGESVAAARGYGIYMGTILFGGDPNTIDDVGTPVAPWDDPGSVHDAEFPGIGSHDVLTLEFGCLYDVSVPADAPVLVTKLCTIELSEQANLSITGGNATRGNVVLLGGGASSAPDYGTPTLITGWVLAQYDLTVTIEDAAADAAGCTVDHVLGNPYDDGDTATLTPNPATGWSFDAWGTNDEENELVGTGPWTLLMNDNKAVTAIFVINTYTVTFIEGDNGTIGGGDLVQVIDHGSNCVAMVPAGNPGHSFVNWTGDHTGTEASLTITNVTAPMNITANFSAPQTYAGPDQTEYNKYITAGFTHEEMASWSNRYQCVGDVMNNTEIFLQDYRVYVSDINELIINWMRKIDDPSLNPAADVTHDSEIFLQDYRVYVNDINELIIRWMDKDGDLTSIYCNTP